MSRSFPVHYNDDMLSRTNKAIPPPPCRNFFPLEIKCDLQDIFFNKSPIPPLKIKNHLSIKGDYYRGITPPGWAQWVAM